MRYGIMESGLSIPVLWAFCSGMNYADPAENAREHIRRITELPLDSFQTEEDVRAIQFVLERWLPLLPPEEQVLSPLLTMVVAYPSKDEAPTLRVAAE